MSKKDEALKLAANINPFGSVENAKARDAAREALAEQPAQQQEPYGWKVYGVNSLFMGEFAEADAKAEAKRIGGTCIAFPLYTSPQPAQQQEPVAWVQPNGELVVRADYGGRIYYSDQPIYRSLPASKPWVGLTLEDRNAIGRHHAYVDNIIRATEAKLREKNT